MKTATKVIPLILLACLLAMACESGGGSNSSSVGVEDWRGTYDGQYWIKGDGPYDFAMSVMFQSVHQISGELSEAPDEESSTYDGYIDGQNFRLTSDANLVFEGDHSGNCLGGTYRSTRKQELSGEWRACKK